MPANLNRKQQREIKAVVERAKKDNGIPQTAQQSIPFQRMFPDGICRVTDSYYTKTIQFQDINYKAAKSALLEGLGLEHLFDHSHELTPKEKEIWMLFDRVDVAELLARDAFAKGAYMLGAEDREIMLK